MTKILAATRVCNFLRVVESGLGGTDPQASAHAAGCTDSRHGQGLFIIASPPD
jgi:hypothetical protein